MEYHEKCSEQHTKEFGRHQHDPRAHTDVPEHIPDVIERVVSAPTRTSEAHRPNNVFRVGEDEDAPVTEPGISNVKRNIVVCLVVCANLVSFISQFSSYVGSFEFSKILGKPVGPGQANWIASAYALTQSGFVLISGRLGDVYGHQRLLLIGGSVLVIFSVVTIFCNTYESFVTARALTGVGGGIVMPNAVAILTVMIPPGTARNISLATFAASPPIGAIVGGLFTGLFISTVGWKYVYVFIALLGTVFYVALFFALPRQPPVDRNGRIDYPGIAMGLGFLILFSFTWNQAPSVGWDTPYIIAVLIISFAMGAAFVVWEQRFAAEPILPIGIFKAPSFGALIFVVLVTYMGFAISGFYVVAWQQNVRGWGVMQVAVGYIPFIFGATFAVFFAAWLIPRLPAQNIMAIGILSSFLANIFLATQPAQQSYWKAAFPSLIFGSMCPDFIYVAAQVIASNSVKKSQQGVAGSLVGTLNLYGNSLGLGFAGTIESQLHKNGASLVLGYRAALYFGAALAVAALVIDVVFVRMPKTDRQGWDEESQSETEQT